MKNKKRTNQCVLPIILAVCFAVVLGITIFLLCNLKRGQAEFIPPPFDFSAIEGIPEVPTVWVFLLLIKTEWVIVFRFAEI